MVTLNRLYNQIHQLVRHGSVEGKLAQRWENLWRYHNFGAYVLNSLVL